MMCDPYLMYILDHMCEMVGTSYCEIDFNCKDWYTKHTWEIEDEAKFKQWLVDYLMSNTQARKAITSCYRPSKWCVSRAADMFIFLYGWRLPNPDKHL